MDLHLIPGAVATPAERAAIDAVLPSSQAPGTRHLLLPALHAAQASAGWISEGALNYICECLSVPPAEAFGVASFYALFSLQPRPPLVVHVCDDIACRTNGAEAICQDLERRFAVDGAPVGDGGATWLRSPCLGQCDRAPAALVQRAGRDPRDWTMTSVTADDIGLILRNEKSDVVSDVLVPSKPHSGRSSTTSERRRTAKRGRSTRADTTCHARS